MVVYVSPAEVNGGILQFSEAIARETMELTDCRLFLPDIVEKSLYQDISNCVVPYFKVKTLNGNKKEILCVAEQIMALSPDVVIFLEDSILMQQLNKILNQKAVKTAMVVHDVWHHPYRKMGIRRILVDILRRRMTRKTIKRINKIILLSMNSEKAFQKKYKSKNTVMFRLPAHIPEAVPQIPSEIKNEGKKFFLFFGRIDEYKGIDTLCKAYSALTDDFKSKTRLVIAGKGVLSKEEKLLIREEQYIMPITRFITDSEMIWLFRNATSVIMPYTEASQSGVLPIAYKFGKLVVVSDLQGLTENVVEGKTGYVFKTIDELSEILYQLNSMDVSVQKVEILRYYQENFLWKNNLEMLFNLLGVRIRNES